MGAVTVEARLLGPPLVVRDGTVYAAPRGKKVWALLAYLALSEQPPTRQHPAAWLLGERRRLRSLGNAVLREGALRAIAGGNVQTAVELATRLVGADPLDEDAHVLLVRAFAATGDEAAVQDQLTASAELFRVEL